jgi:hypothetical protein
MRCIQLSKLFLSIIFRRSMNVPWVECQSLAALMRVQQQNPNVDPLPPAKSTKEETRVHAMPAMKETGSFVKTSMSVKRKQTTVIAMLPAKIRMEDSRVHAIKALKETVSSVHAMPAMK